MLETKTCRWWAIGAFLVGTVAGSGSIWQWMNLRIAQRSQDVEEILKIAEIRKQIGERLEQIIEMSDDYQKILRDDPNNDAPDTEKKILQLKARLEVVKTDFTIMEVKLAHIENRPPRRIGIEFIGPSPPKGLELRLN